MNLQEVLWRIPYQSLNSLASVSRNFYRIIRTARLELSFWRSEHKIDRISTALPSPEAYEIYYVILSQCSGRPGVFSYDNCRAALKALGKNESVIEIISNSFFLADCRAGTIEIMLPNYLRDGAPIIKTTTSLLGRNKMAAEWYSEKTGYDLLTIYKKLLGTLITIKPISEVIPTSAWFFETWPEYDTLFNRTETIGSFVTGHLIFTPEDVRPYHEAIMSMSPPLRAKFYGNYMPVLTKEEMEKGLKTYRVTSYYIVLDNIIEWMGAHQDRRMQGLTAMSFILEKIAVGGYTPTGANRRTIQYALHAALKSSDAEADPLSERSVLVRHIASLVEKLV